MDLTKLYVYDIETYKELFSFSIVRADGKHKKTFACSKYSNDITAVFKCLDYLHDNNCYLVGFNSNQFDWPIVQKLLDNQSSVESKSGKAIAKQVFDLAQKQIESFKEGAFGNTIKYDEQYVKQIDLFKVHHFDNVNKMTSLKLIEFNLRMDNLEDLPYEITSVLDTEMQKSIIKYNEHDVEATRLFLIESLALVSFRFELTEKHGVSFLNHNDGKIGKDYFKSELEKRQVKLNTFINGKKVMKQSPRSKIAIADCLFDYYDFKHPACIAVKEWFSKQVISETKGVFSDIEEHLLGEVAQYSELTVKRQRFKEKPDTKAIDEFKKIHPLGWVEEEELKTEEWLFDEQGNHVTFQPLDEDGSPDFTKKPKKVKVKKKSYWGCYKVAETLNILLGGLRIDFGVGGIHASLVNKIAKQTSKYILRDCDVSSMYPNLAISNNIYPEHLGEGFCDIYKDVYEQRKSYPKSAPENAMLKLALNCVYGDSNNKYSNFYDPMYTMKITINGQLSLLMLAERFLGIQGLKLIQLNTDGCTVALPVDKQQEYQVTCAKWEKDVGLQLEFVDYKKMVIRDVNNYLAEYSTKGVKRKGVYQYEGLGWHQNQSCLVVPKAIEAALLYGKDIEEFIIEHNKPENVYDFMLRTKVDRSSKLVLVKDTGEEIPQQRICRYYPSLQGGKLIKIMKPLESSVDKEPRRFNIESQYKVKTCNNMKDFESDIDLNYYINEAKKLLVA